MNIDEKLSPRSKLLLFQTLELLRKEIQPRFADWKDADDWLFSELDFTKDELAQIYKGRGVMYYDGSAIDMEKAALLCAREASIERLLGRQIFSDEAQVVIDDLRVMLNMDALDLDKGFASDAEREDMVRYIERVIHEYHYEEAERKIKDGFHGYMDASIPLSVIRFGEPAQDAASLDDQHPEHERHASLDAVIAAADEQCAEKKSWAEEKSDELAQKPRSEWTQEDWDAHSYIENLYAEADFFDSLDDR